jgi:hypothetical protein
VKIVRNDLVAKFMLEGVLGGEFCAPFSGFVVMDEGFPVGAYILNCYTGHDVEFTVALRAPLSIRLARQIARDCFEGLGVSRVTAKTRMSNAPARRGLEACGFNMESIARDHFGDEDAAVYALLRRKQKLVRF